VSKVDPSASEGTAELLDVFSPDPEPTQKAQTEATKMSGGKDLKADGDAKEHDRHQAFRDHVNRAALAVFWTLICCVILGVLLFSWHLLLPESCHFLSEKQLEKLQTLLGAALLSSALTQYTNKRIT